MPENTAVPLNEIQTEYDGSSEYVITSSQTVIVKMVRDSSGVPRTIYEKRRVVLPNGDTAAVTNGLPVIKVKLTQVSTSVTEDGTTIPRSSWPQWLRDNYPANGGSFCFYVLSKYGIDADAASCDDESDWNTEFDEYRFGEISFDGTDFTITDNTVSPVSTYPDALTTNTLTLTSGSITGVTAPAGTELADWVQYIAANANYMDFLWQPGDEGVDMSAYAWIEWPTDGTSPLNPDPWDGNSETTLANFPGVTVSIDAGKFHLSAPTGTTVRIYLELRTWKESTGMDVQLAPDDAYDTHVGDDTEVTSVEPDATFDLSRLNFSANSPYDVWEYWDCVEGCISSNAIWASVWIVVKDDADLTKVYVEQWVDGYTILETP